MIVLLQMDIAQIVHGICERRIQSNRFLKMRDRFFNLTVVVITDRQIVPNVRIIGIYF